MSAKTRQRNNLKRKQRAAAKLRAESQKAVKAHKAMDAVLNESIQTVQKVEEKLAKAKVVPTPTATGTRATCPGCGKSQKVTKAGAIGKHGDCPGAGWIVGS
jgi:hypothetical protein